ncbi:MAG: histidine phosphatase family protein [Thermosynechococcaceae cyanobacterium]
MNLLLMRHAESVGNRESRIQGRVDYILSEQGVEQAHALGQALVEQSWPPTYIYTSPLQRAIHTSDILRDYWATRGLSITIQALPDLQEVKNGVLEGLTWVEAQAQYPDLCNALTASPDWLPIPGAETLKACRDRAHQAFQSLITQHSNHDRLWVISHGGFLQYLIGAVMGCDRIWGITIPPTAIFEFELDIERWDKTDQNRYNALLWRIRRFNDAEHLKSLVADFS